MVTDMANITTAMEYEVTHGDLVYLDLTVAHSKCQGKAYSD